LILEIDWLDTKVGYVLDVPKVLPKLSSNFARYIGANVWKNGDDIRDVISIGKLIRKSDGPQEIEQIMNTMAKYGYDDAAVKKRDR
jgi:hypothetical protein